MKTLYFLSGDFDFLALLLPVRLAGGDDLAISIPMQLTREGSDE